MSVFDRGYSIPEGADEFERAHIRILDQAGLCLNCGEEPDPDPSIHPPLHVQDESTFSPPGSELMDAGNEEDEPESNAIPAYVCKTCKDTGVLSYHESPYNIEPCPDCSNRTENRSEPEMFHDIAESQGTEIWDFTR